MAIRCTAAAGVDGLVTVESGTSLKDVFPALASWKIANFFRSGELRSQLEVIYEEKIDLFLRKNIGLARFGLVVVDGFCGVGIERFVFDEYGKKAP